MLDDPRLERGDAREAGVQRRRAPRPLSHALMALQRQIAPATPLADIQAVWNEAVGVAVSAAARPTAERGGTRTLTCTASVWAQELTLMGPQLARSLNERLGADLVREVRCTVGS